MHTFKNVCLALGWGAVLGACTSAGSPYSIADIYQEFQSVPDSTRTKVWWFHGETETTREGITADLEAFCEAGVGGVVYYDQIHGSGEGACAIFSPEWWEALKFSAAEARRLGLSFEINLSNGFVAGGPWITKEMSMKRLCHSQVVVEAGATYDDVLPPPSADEFWDVRTLAFPVPDAVEWGEKRLIERTVKYDAPTKLTYDLGRPFTARSLTYSEACNSKHPTAAMNWPGPPADHFYGDGYLELPPIGSLEASEDGKTWRVVRTIPTLYKIHHRVKTISFPAVTARYFRLNLHGWNRPDGQRPRTLELRRATLSSQAMTDEWENKAGVNSEYVTDNLTPSYASREVIDPSKVIDLSDLMQADGRLRWCAPDGEGRWVILRVAQTSTRGHTKHGRPGQMGLECDKMSREAARLQWNNFAQVILDTLDRYGLKPTGVVMDSHEMGSHNWTHGYEREFEAMQGYDLTPYLPALLGYVVGSKEQSEEVLFHHRQTIAHLVNHRYFAALDTLAMEAGVTLTAQATGNGQSMTSDNIAAKGSVRRPQGEFWGKHADASYDIKEAASAAHVYGKPIASAEAYTDVKYSQTLAYFKRLADYAYAYQLNEFVVCASAYQPWTDRRPGNTAHRREYCLNRNNTMWPMSRGFWDYQSRCAYLMRQGRPVADLCIYLGSEVSNKLLSYRLPEIPEGYDWDVCTDDALLHLFSAEEGRLKARCGTSWQVLVVERLARLTPEAEEKVEQLKRQGVKVYDARKEGDYGLQAFLTQAGVAPDAAFRSANRPDDRLFFAHRRLNDAELYFFDNHSPKSYVGEVTLRGSKGLTAEYWNPDTGLRYALRSKAAANGDLTVHLALDAREAGFVVLRSPGAMSAPALKRTWGDETMERPMNDEWTVYFLLPKTLKCIQMPVLTSWTNLEDEELKHHSGTAIYNRAFKAPRLFDGKRAYLHVDGLEGASSVWVSGRFVGYLWCAPWEVDITDYLKPDYNEVCIEVANQLTNRMIGDLSLPEAERTTWATTPIVTPADTLLPAGITGGVSLLIR
ncbi:MAG: glycosyl hydrolase family 2 [Bacteroides sp.]|nr:glycosyl hydrolase family 2 [Bacteroides sp.]